MIKKQFKNMIVMFTIGSCFQLNEVVAADNRGEISGVFLENASPCSLQINIHNAITGLYFGKVVTDSKGIFTVPNLPFGKYYLITHPVDVGVRMPLQWKTIDLEIKETKPIYTLRYVDGFAVEIFYPKDGQIVDLEKVNDRNPLNFSWRPYYSDANYEIEIYSTDTTQYFNSGRINTANYSFNGIFRDGSRFKKRLYRWQLKVYPENTEWIGEGKPQDLLIGDLGTIKNYEGDYVRLDFPKWYESTIATLDLIRLLDTCYLLQKELAAGQFPSLGPLPGEKQVLLYDPSITFAYSGNPIHFGKRHITENNFPLFLTFHEMGHNFQFGGLPGFAQLLGGSYYNPNPIFFGFSEGLATLVSLYITEKIDRDNLKPLVRDMFEAENKSMRTKFISALEFYENLQPDRNHITPDIIDGILIRLGDRYGWDIFPVFFRIFLENETNDQIYQLAGDDEVKRITIFVTAFSAVAREDLREQFRKYDFPVDDQYFQVILPLVKQSLRVK